MGYTRDSRGNDGKRAASVRRVLWIVLLLNLAVAFSKLVVGRIIASVAMQADGFHSLFDGASNIIGLVGLSIAARPPDRDHPYGHGKYETYAAAAIGSMLLLAAWNVGRQAWVRLAGGGAAPRVEVMAFAVMIVTVAVNLTVALYERRMAGRLGSDILAADASHTGSDILVSLGVIGGLVAVRLGYPLADPLLAVAVAFVILWTAAQVLHKADRTLSDMARLPVGEVCLAVLRVPGVLGCHSVRTRGAATEVLVDLHIQVDPSISVAAGHLIAEKAERAVCDRFPEVADIIAHLEPYDDYQAGKTAVERAAGLQPPPPGPILPDAER